jgi:MFS family permease
MREAAGRGRSCGPGIPCSRSGLASRFFAGPLLDAAGRRRILLISLAAFTAASLLYLPAGSLALLLGLLLPLTGFGGMYVWLGVLMLASICLYHAVHGRKRRTAGLA